MGNKRRTTIGLVLATAAILVVAACIRGIPADRTVLETVHIGSRSDGCEVICETQVEHRVFPVSPEGFFSCGSLSYVEYYLQDRGQRTRLAFFSDIGLSYKLLNPVLPIYGTNCWAAFRLSRVDRNDVDLTMYVFDHSKLLHTFEIKDAVRTDCSAGGWELAATYSISRSTTDSSITIRTLHGVVVYGPRTQSLTAPENGTGPE